MEATARFGLEGATKNLIENALEGNITFTGEATVAGVRVLLDDTLSRREVLSQLAEHPTYLATNTTMTAGAPLPDKFLYEEIGINWRWSVMGKGHKALEQSLGETRHNLYITDAPLPGKPKYLTLLDVVTKAMTAAGLGAKPTEQERINALWAAFFD